MINNRSWEFWDKEVIEGLRMFCTSNIFSPFFLLISSKAEREAILNESSFLNFLYENDLSRNYLKTVSMFPVEQVGSYSLSGYEYLVFLDKVVRFLNDGQYKSHNLREYMLLSAKQLNLIKK